MRKTSLREHSMVLKWIAMRKKTVTMIRDTADKIDWHYKNTTIVGASSAAIVGGIASPVAMSTMIGAAILASAVALFGGGGNVGSISDISKLKLSQLQKQIDADNKELEKLIQHKNKTCSPHGNNIASEMSLHNGSETKAARILREMADKYEEQMNVVTKHLK